MLSVVFRGKFSRHRASVPTHKLTLAGQFAPLQSPPAFAALLRRAAQRKWSFYCKRPLPSRSVLTYLSRYTHLAIANSRLLKTCPTGESPSGGETTPMAVKPAHDDRRREFLRRFCFMFSLRIRTHSLLGLLANRHLLSF